LAGQLSSVHGSFTGEGLVDDVQPAHMHRDSRNASYLLKLLYYQ
jgi:hypothetical protein